MRQLILLVFLVGLSWEVKSQNQKNEKIILITEISTDKSYGFKKKKSIKVGAVRNEYAYIAQLTGPNGEEVTARRLGSCCAVKSSNAPFGKAMLDRWEIRYEGVNEPIVIFLNGYDFEEPKCPIGLNFRKP